MNLLLLTGLVVDFARASEDNVGNQNRPVRNFGTGSYTIKQKEQHPPATYKTSQGSEIHLPSLVVDTEKRLIA